MENEANTLTILDKLKEMLVVRNRGISPDKVPESAPFYVFPEHFSTELGLTFEELKKALLQLGKKYPGQIVFESVGNLSTSPEIMERPCIPVDEIKIDKAYFRVRLSSNLVSPKEMNDTRPIVEIDNKGRVSISFAGHKPIVVSKKKTLRGALLFIMGRAPWGAARNPDAVKKEIKDRVGVEPTGKQIDRTMIEIRRVINKKKGPRLELEDERPDNLWVLKVG